MRTLFGFPGGLVLDDHKDRSADTPIETLPVPPLLVLPLKQHNGLPAIPLVKEGQRVQYGQLIARAAEGRSAGVHSPADGEISFIGLHPVPDESGLYQPCIGICTDETGSHQEEEMVDDVSLSNEDMHARIAQAGIVGLGGAGFPSAQKLSQTPVKWLIINGAECEPYISCDDRLMQERAPAIIEGVQILLRLLRPEQVLFAIEDNKPAAIKAIADACHETNIEVVVIPTKYPSGAQKQLLQNLLGFEIPSGKHSVDLGVVMYNTGTCFAIARAIAHSEPLVRRIVTVAGQAVTRPGNYEVAIGTPIEYVLESAGLNPDKLRRVIMGGPIMGIALNELSAPVSKLTNCLIAAGPGELDETLTPRPCIRCGDCAEVCPASLLPQQLFWQIQSEQYENAAALNLAACIECGACAYVCPSQIALVQYYRHGKAQLRQQHQDRALAQHAKIRFDARANRLSQNLQKRATRRSHTALLGDMTEPTANEIPFDPPNSAALAPANTVVSNPDNRLADVMAAARRAKERKQTDPEIVSPARNADDNSP